MSGKDQYYVNVAEKRATILGEEWVVRQVSVELLDKNGRYAAVEGISSGQQGGMDHTGTRLAQEENLKQEELLEFVNWTQMEKMLISATALGVEAECEAIVLGGRSDILFPGYAVLDLEMQGYCLISSTLSGKLFGGEYISGVMVDIQGRKMEVLDVIDSEESFLAYEAGEQEAVVFDRAAVKCMSGKYRKTVEDFQQLCGVWEQIESRILVWITQAVCLLVPCILWIVLVISMLRNAREMEYVRISELPLDTGKYVEAQKADRRENGLEGAWVFAAGRRYFVIDPENTDTRGYDPCQVVGFSFLDGVWEEAGGGV